jgi:hypothetical protein
MSLEKALKDKRDLVLSIAQRYGAFNVRVFGSVASGMTHENSDIDFLVDMEPGHSLLDRIALKQELEDLLACRVDVATPGTLHELMKEQILQEAISL